MAIASCCAAGAMVTGAVLHGDERTRDRPPPAHTGGFGEPTCQTCHFGAELDAGPGTFAVDGLPAAYEPGRTYSLRVSLNQADLRAAGFQLSIRHDDGSQAGTLGPAPDGAERIDLAGADGITFVHHSFAGSEPDATDAAHWNVSWTAPAGGGAVVLHAVANGADGDDSPLGDFVYSTSARAGAGKVVSDLEHRSDRQIRRPAVRGRP